MLPSTHWHALWEPTAPANAVMRENRDFRLGNPSEFEAERDILLLEITGTG